MKKKVVRKLQLNKIRIAGLIKIDKAGGGRLTADPDNPCDPIHTMLLSCRGC
ncbi:hypothetical protein [Chitinophaga sp. Cy-1792]|uniref:hypothetical protein n=1 Tax=Chitinophaga sp. Cy-1792 TaxID=2608339 RepID=UPI00141E2210|nr:hypothetical protein [Chitinophaga sp. Cy-1792]